MNPLLLTPLADIVKAVVARVWPDPVEQAKVQLELAKMQMDGSLAELTAATDLAKAQIGVNAIEAANPSLFVSGWRPAAGWMAVSGLGYQVMVRPIAGWIMNQWMGWSMPPSLEIESLMTLLFGLLGLGAYRTYEKVKGAA